MNKPLDAKLAELETAEAALAEIVEEQSGDDGCLC